MSHPFKIPGRLFLCTDLLVFIVLAYVFSYFWITAGTATPVNVLGKEFYNPIKYIACLKRLSVVAYSSVSEILPAPFTSSMSFCHTVVADDV